MKQIILFCLALFLYLGCSVKTKPPLNGIVREKTMIMDDKDPIMPFETEYEYKDGKVVRYTQFYPNGTKKSEVQRADSTTNKWASDELNFSEFYESGNKKRISHFMADSVITETDWYENGRLKMEFSRSTGKKDKVINYYFNGMKKEEFEFANELRHGIWAEWDSVGNQTRKENYVDGILKK
jgi:antitoxin component YwqK of YwqJK toxin-antitoxin module